MLFAFGADKLGVEDMLKSAYLAVFKTAPTEWYVLAMGVCVLFFLLQQWKAMKVGEARLKY
eukprot:gene1283-22756_t